MSEGNPFAGGGSDEEFSGEVDLSFPPEGICIVQLLNVTKERSRSSGNEMFVWDFGFQEYLDPAEEGTNWTSESSRVYTSLSKAAAWKLEETLAALGIEMDGAGKFNFKKADVIGTIAKAAIKHGEFNGKRQVNIDALTAPDEGAGTKRDIGGFAHGAPDLASGDDIPFS